MDAVLGLSVTPSAVGLVVVESRGTDGSTADCEAFEIPRRRRASTWETCRQAAAAVLRVESAAAARGRRLRSIGVTWSDDVRDEAALLMEELTRRGFCDVMPLPLPEASEALAWGIAEVVGLGVTAVCVVESQTVLALVVHTGAGAVQTAVNRAIDSEEALVGWLRTVFDRADWRPETLVMVGSGGALEELMPQLERVLGVPVFAPAGAELALARGTALAAAHRDDVFAGAGVSDGVAAPVTDGAHRRTQRRRTSQTAPLAMLMTGAASLVVSVSLAISLEATADDAAEPAPAARSSAGVAAAADSVPLAPPRPAQAALVAQTPQEVAPPVFEEAEPLPAEPLADPAADLAVPPDGVPPPPDAAVPEPFAPPPEAPPPPPEALAPPPEAPAPPPEGEAPPPEAPTPAEGPPPEAPPAEPPPPDAPEIPPPPAP